MYKAKDHSQFSFLDFNQPLGLHMNPNNRWVRLAEIIPWDEYEQKYAELFRSTTGNVAKPFRMALGSLIIQKKLGFSDRELVEEIAENPYLQYFIGLPGFQEEPPFEASVLVSFRKRINVDMASLLNEKFLERLEKEHAAAQKKSHDKDDQTQTPGSGSAGGSGPESSPDDSASDATGGDDKGTENKGTLILDATCAPQNIRFPQDFSLLNECREKLEKIIGRICTTEGVSRPRMYPIQARQNYLNLAKSKRRSASKIRKVIRKQLGYVKRDLGYIDRFVTEQEYCLQSREQELVNTIRKVYDQQKYMFDNHTHRVEDRIVSITQPFIRPIVRGKAKAPVEFGLKFDLSLDEHGMGRIEKISSNAYNEGGCLQAAVENYRQRTGHYPERVLVDQIYRTRANRRFCSEHGIRMSGPRLGRPSTETALRDRKIEYRDNTDRIEVERSFSLSKRCYGLGLITMKREDTTFGAIGLSIFVTNLFRALGRRCELFFAVFKVLLCRAFWTGTMVTLDLAAE